MSLSGRRPIDSPCDEMENRCRAKGPAAATSSTELAEGLGDSSAGVWDTSGETLLPHEGQCWAPRGIFAPHAEHFAFRIRRPMTTASAKEMSRIATAAVMYSSMNTLPFSKASSSHSAWKPGPPGALRRTPSPVSPSAWRLAPPGIRCERRELNRTHGCCRGSLRHLASARTRTRRPGKVRAAPAERQSGPAATRYRASPPILFKSSARSRPHDHLGRLAGSFGDKTSARGCLHGHARHRDVHSTRQDDRRRSKTGSKELNVR